MYPVSPSNLSPLVSVIIPAYNAERYIKDTILSVEKQSYSHWELLVVVDGATDDTEKIARELSKADHRITCYSKSNSGVSNTRNYGFNLSNGSFIAFLDADDIWLPDNLSQKVEKFQNSPVFGLVHSDAEIINENNQPQGIYKQGKEGNILEDLLLWNGTCIPAPSSILVKRSVIESVGGFDPELSTAADQEFFFRVAQKYQVGRVASVTWQYRVHGQNMHNNIRLMERDEILVYQKAKKNGMFHSKKFRRRCLSNMYLILAGSWWKEGKNKLRSIYFVLKSIRYYPANIKKLIKKFV